MFQDEINDFINFYFNSLDNCKYSEILKYSVEGGQCIRGFIVKEIIENKNKESLCWEPIVAVEIIHAASLIIDDLPCMDNDKIRRGKESTFLKFGEHNTILVSFFMMSEAMRILSNKAIVKHVNQEDNVKLIKIILDIWNQLLGKELIVGQMMDLKIECKEMISIDNISLNNFNENLIKYKTSSLFAFSFLIGYLFSIKNFSKIKNFEEEFTDFKEMGHKFGIMYQIMDDCKDKNKDDKHINYLLSNGFWKTKKTYSDARFKLIYLLNKHGLLTDKFKKLILKVDENLNQNIVIINKED